MDWDAEPKPSTTGTLIYIMLGPILWALAHMGVYSAHTLVCTQYAPRTLAVILVLAITAVLAAVLILLTLKPDPFARALGVVPQAAGRRTYDSLARLIGGLSAVAIIWTGGTALVIAPCIQAR